MPIEVVSDAKEVLNDVADGFRGFFGTASDADKKASITTTQGVNKDKSFAKELDCKEGVNSREAHKKKEIREDGAEKAKVDEKDGSEQSHAEHDETKVH